MGAFSFKVLKINGMTFEQGKEPSPKSKKLLEATGWKLEKDPVSGLTILNTDAVPNQNVIIGTDGAFSILRSTAKVFKSIVCCGSDYEKIMDKKEEDHTTADISASYGSHTIQVYAPEGGAANNAFLAHANMHHKSLDEAAKKPKPKPNPNIIPGSPPVISSSGPIEIYYSNTNNSHNDQKYDGPKNNKM